MTKSKQPQYRFDSFEGEWEEKKLGEISNIVRGASPRPIQDPKWFDAKSDIGWLRISDVTEQEGRITYLQQRISELGQEKTRVLKDPHLLLSIAATVGKPVINYVKTGVHDGFLVFLDPKFNREFMFQWLDMFRPYWNKYGQPGSQVNLNSEIIRNQVINLPSLPEQEAIGELFQTVDQLIQLQRQKLAILKEQKQTFLRKMFPAQGQKVPEIRLQGFDGEWEEKELGDIVQITMGQSPSSQNYTTNPSDYILVQGNADIKNGYVFPRVWTTQITKQADKGDIILSVRAPVGDVGKTNYHVIIGRGVAAIKGNEFIFQILKYLKEIGYWKRISTGSTFDSISSSDIKYAKIQIPSLSEQEAIGNFFQTLDQQIAQSEEKLTELKALKQTLLNRLFV
ncbi:TPA: restriction endonuclease subunit S [Streptococcus pyogenes]|uniref:restriction endonuclease subunit S n=1 Tax=Streptococcus pyogenes TaxID=1314 RepID=UPI0001E10410|nr:restriction endonuclease subunit S [Streptococcus pyogenes]HER4514972.1 restriction endonuclease subunit S [Streptococcus pyogenes NGAS743]HER4523672.1 restriction endonuclease subunit S [Streptococcus pyogenes NGAS747]HER4527082.1 restriction endonuclease subunit S [Streptococcus pyogenes NGAS739]HER4539126.1 restriction endonuclease subunit S [Streptococcus pyogenes NGAS668]HER4542466.1 restriction endonuclease subunit S [Streptococcus pyogenes NGAS669]HER4550867.1 restriction endonuclea